jgi:alpha-amylase/alpha-mannosidase (GH57 family)
VKSSRYLVIHGHFYQPPRENPFSGSIALQPSASPYPNWNVRINKECYSPNARGRIMDSCGRIRKIVNNYRRLSFNIGPTLLNWLRDEDPETLSLIVEADKQGAALNGGHGPALAQVFNHIIMPLANSADKRTQVLWGIEHFKHAFHRFPEGMWLAETAVDTESLAIMAQEGIKFTILSQGQIEAIRPLSDRSAPFRKLDSAVDPRQPYRVFWGSGRNDYIDVFVYDGPVSREIAFENLLRDGQIFLNRIELAFGNNYQDHRPRLVNLATDGESYGHHFQFGEMALSWLFDQLTSTLMSASDPIIPTNYGAFLELFPPIAEAKIIENTSWSCAHGVERWRSDCGCHTGGESYWNQRWRTPLRDGLNWLRNQLIEVFETSCRPILKDPWRARDKFVSVLNSDYGKEQMDAFLDKQGSGSLTDSEKLLILKQMEAQLMSLYMFTSCGWFFDDLTGLEPLQNLRYASRAIALCQDLTKVDLTEGLLIFLRQAKPNDPDYPTGQEVWDKLVVPQILTDSLAAAHFMASKFMKAPEAYDAFRYPEISVVTEKWDEENKLAARLSISDPRLGSMAVEKIALAQNGSGKSSISITIADPSAKDQSLDLKVVEGERFDLNHLWPSVRQSLLGDMVKDFFDELKSYTLKSFDLYLDTLARYGGLLNSSDWMVRFVLRVVAEAELEVFLEPIKNGDKLDFARLEETFNTEKFGYSFRNEPIFNQYALFYLKKLFSQAGAASARSTLISEIVAFVRLLKKQKMSFDSWEVQNCWHKLVVNKSFLDTLSPDALKDFLELGEELGFSPSSFLT